ncbi:MAG: energy transducer TonB [Betaproteobacteria bacterium]|nr:energy transducer TonB [Betaproteobacteria bacterium]
MTERGERDSLRVFGYALLASIVAHSLVLLALPGLHAGVARMTAPTPLLAWLAYEQPLVRAAPSARARPAAPPPPQAVVALPPSQAMVAAAPPAEPATAADRPAEARSIAPASPPAAAVPSARDAAPSPQQAALRSPTGTATAAAAPAGPDPALVRQYRVAVMGAAQRYKRYPRIAMENAWQGRVEVTMKVRANGSLAALDVKTSTGHAALDHQALDMIREANSRTPMPETLRGSEFAIDIPVVFSLRDPST